jgi:hypothetical protein
LKSAYRRSLTSNLRTSVSDPKTGNHLLLIVPLT